MLSFIKFNKNFLTILYFFIFLIIGFFSFSDYGISIDEDNTRINGFVSLKYIFEIFSPKFALEIDKIVYAPGINEFKEQGIGVIYDLPMALIELVFKIEDSRNYFLFRHFLNFLIFFISVYFFYLLAKKRFNSWIFGILASTFLIVSPRIFAESFYNNKDLIFLSLFIISLYTAINFLVNPSVKNTIYFTFSSALAIDVRIIGIFLPILIYAFYLIKISQYNNLKENSFKISLIFIFSNIFFIMIFWPYLWDDPINKFIFIINKLSNIDVGIYNYYLGNYINAKFLPWHYPFVWQIITIPILYILLFFIGFIKILSTFVYRLSQEEDDNRLNWWTEKEELYDLIFFFTYLIPLTIVFIFNSTLYDGWRHLYFIYPSFIMLSLSGLNFISIKLFSKIKKFFFTIIFLTLLPTVFWMIKYHPYQYSYFNIISEKKFNKLFEMDYWGLSNHDSLEYIAKNSNGVVKVSKISTTDLMLSKKFLNKNIRNKINIVNISDEPDYIINNYRDWSGNTKDYKTLIPNNYNIFYESIIDGIPINTVYKKNK